MGNKTTDAEVFYALQQGLFEVAQSIVQLSKLILASFALTLCAFGLMLFQWVNHSLLAPICAGLVVTTIVALFWCWFALPEDLTELFERIEVPKLSEK